MDAKSHHVDELIRFGASVNKRTVKSIKLLQVELGMDEQFTGSSARNTATMELLVKCADLLLKEAKAELRDPDHESFVKWLDSARARPVS